MDLSVAPKSTFTYELRYAPPFVYISSSSYTYIVILDSMPILLHFFYSLTDNLLMSFRFYSLTENLLMSFCFYWISLISLFYCYLRYSGYN